MTPTEDDMDALTDIITRLRAALAEQEWRPIETAPRDIGEFFDVWVTMPGGNVRYRVADCYKQYCDGLIYTSDTDGEPMLVEDATHWMPIPKGPERAP
jgi:hypothetical protein